MITIIEISQKRKGRLVHTFLLQLRMCCFLVYKLFINWPSYRWRKSSRHTYLRDGMEVILCWQRTGTVRDPEDH